MSRMDIKAPYAPLGKEKNADYCLQDGKIYGWSESNIGYELAWWLTGAGDPVNDGEHVQNILRDRPFDKAWLALALEKQPALVMTHLTKSEPLFFPDLRSANEARQEEWDPSGKFKDIWWRLNELAGEAGEVCNILKKLYREELELPGSRATVYSLAEELADVAICLDLVAMEWRIEVPPPVNGTIWSGGHVPRAGTQLIQMLGQLIQHEIDANRQTLFNRGTRLCWAMMLLREIAAHYDIDLDKAIVQKFNATSEKVGLKTRLAD